MNIFLFFQKICYFDFKIFRFSSKFILCLEKNGSLQKVPDSNNQILSLNQSERCFQPFISYVQYDFRTMKKAASTLIFSNYYKILLIRNSKVRVRFRCIKKSFGEIISMSKFSFKMTVYRIHSYLKQIVDFFRIKNKYKKNLVLKQMASLFLQKNY